MYMIYMKYLTLLTLFFAVSGNAVFDSNLNICDSVTESRECEESEESEGHEKIELDEIFVFSQNQSFISNINNRNNFLFFDISFKDIHIEIILPPPDLA
jgi:hypothetical protein